MKYSHKMKTMIFTLALVGAVGFPAVSGAFTLPAMDIPEATNTMNQVMVQFDQVKKAINEIKAAKESIATVAANGASLAQLGKAAAQAAQTAKQANDLRIELAALKDEVTTGERRMSDAKKKLEDLNKSKSTLTDRISELQKKYDDVGLIKTGQEAIKEREAIQNEMNQAKASLQKVLEAVPGIETDFNAAVAGIKNAKNKIPAIEQRIAELVKTGNPLSSKSASKSLPATAVTAALKEKGFTDEILKSDMKETMKLVSSLNPRNAKTGDEELAMTEVIENEAREARYAAAATMMMEEASLVNADKEREELDKQEPQAEGLIPKVEYNTLVLKSLLEESFRQRNIQVQHGKARMLTELND